MSNKPSSLRKTFVAVATASALTGCTISMQSPLSTTEQTNAKATSFDFEKALHAKEKVKTGAPKEEVLAAFSLQENQMRILSKEDVNKILYGQATLNISFEKREEAQAFANSLQGLSHEYKSIRSDKKFSATNSVTTYAGVGYTFVFIFKDGKLYDPVHAIPTPGPVNKVETKGYFSDLNLFNAVRGRGF